MQGYSTKGRQVEANYQLEEPVHILFMRLNLVRSLLSPEYSAWDSCGAKAEAGEPNVVN